MKKYIYQIIGLPLAATALFCIVSFISQNGFSSQDNARNTTFINATEFKTGDILLPDYACSDTLIVQDATGLNKDIALIEQGIIDATDSVIDSTLHIYCTVK